MPKERRHLPRLVCGAVLAVLLALLVPLLSHKSKHPWILGLYSKTYLAIVMMYCSAIGLTVLAFRKSEQRWADAFHLAKTYGFGFWFLIWVLLVLGGFGIYWATEDTDFRNLGFAFVALGACVWWVVVHFARRLGRVLTNLALASTAGFLALIAAELVMATFPIVSPLIEMLRDQKIKLYQFERLSRSGREWYLSFLMTDPELGYKQRPDFSVVVKRASDGKSVELRTDSWGFFNHDVDSSRSCDVACVGDSFVAVPWPAILQSKTGLRVASFAIPAYSPPQYTILVKRYAVKAKPKVLFYCLYVNDPTEAVGYEEWKKSGLNWYTFKGNAWFGFPRSYAGTGRLLVKEYALRFSRAYALLDFAAFRRRKEHMPITAHPIPYETANFTLIFDRASFTVMTNMGDDAVKRGINIIRQNLHEAGRICREAGIRMIVVLLPPKELVHYEALKERTKPDDPIENMPAFYKALRELCAALHLECYDLTDRFRQEVARTGKAFYGQVDIHWDDDGLYLMAEIAAEILWKSGEFPGQ